MICSAQLHSLFRRGANRLQPCRESRITTMEIWRVIPSAPRYLVSSNGRVKSTFTNRILKARINEQGYRNVSLSISGRIYSRRICRLVCEAFFGPCPLGKCAAHENGVRSDDRVKNLKWKTFQENSNDTLRHGNRPFGEKSKWAKLNSKDIPEILRLRGDGCSWGDLEKKFGVSKSTIRNIVTRRQWKHITCAPSVVPHRVASPT